MAAAAAETVSLRLCEPVVGDFAQICAWWVHHIHTKSFSSTEWCKFLSQEMQENHTHFSPLSVWATFTIEFQTTPQNCKECLRSPWKVVGFPQIIYFLSDYQRLCKQIPKLIKIQKIYSTLPCLMIVY